MTAAPEFRTADSALSDLVTIAMLLPVFSNNQIAAYIQAGFFGAALITSGTLATPARRPSSG